MANFTSAELLAIIQTAQPVFNGLRYFQTKQLAKQRIYPAVEIEEEQPQSPDTGVQLINYKTKFKVKVYVRYFNRAQDTNNLDILEDNILAAVKAANLNTVGKLILEGNDFQRGPIEDNPLNVNGIQSTLTIYLQELAAVTGIIGLQQSMDIGTILGLQILSSTGSRGKNTRRRADTYGNTKVNKGEDAHSEFFEYPYTKTNYDEIQSLIDAESIETITLHEASQADTTLNGKPVYQRWSVRFDVQKTVILQIEVED